MADPLADPLACVITTIMSHGQSIERVSRASMSSVYTQHTDNTIFSAILLCLHWSVVLY